ncbi:MAG TPA: GGDEF domain-containing protein [Streptosporangiaceae bacterium]|nr:GGDEF domain-containing protein [Streptosporangiaceae bacterium]
MNPSSPAWIVIGAALSVAAIALLVLAARRGQPGSRWLAVAATAWGAAFAAQGVGAGQIAPAPIQLTLSDLLALLGLPALVLALIRQAHAADRDGSAGDSSSWDSGWVIDTGLLGLAVFSVAWIAVLRSAHATADVGSGSFAVDLIHPVADLAILSGTLALAVKAGRRALAPYLALCAATLGDFLAVQARAMGDHPGWWPQLAWLVAIGLLGASALPVPTVRSRPSVLGSAAEPPLTTLISLLAAGVAVVVTFVFAIATWGHSGPAPLIVAVGLMLALLLKIIGLLRQAAAMSAQADEAGTQFHQLADRTSDVVLLCDAVGRVSYASKAITHYGYSAESMAGTKLLDLVHPDDLPNVMEIASVVAASGSVAGGSVAGASGGGTVACRVRSSDGTWRHVQATISRYFQAGRPDLLMVTAKDVSDQVALRRQVTHLTFHDGLTGLPNRSYLEERTKDLLARNREALDQPEQTGAIFVDLDGFTAINDSVGHGAGDLVLAQAGRRLRGVVPPHDTVARWGGDEFAVLIERATSPQEIVDIAERMLGLIEAEPFRVAGRDVAITASVGVAFADPEVAEHLLRNADLAMSRAKDMGGGRVEVFAAHMHADVIRRMELAADLRAAIAEGTLGIEYQPVVELATSRVASVEALVRWSRDGEQVDPEEFLTIAEESGLIVPLGEWVLTRACEQVIRWRESGWLIDLSVNVSHRQLSAARFAESVLTAVDDSGLPRSALTLEVTERVLIEVGESILDGLARLRLLGVRLAIDDFGTGYASLAYLRQLPVDTIKIDPSFVAGLGVDGTLAMLTRTIVQVGHDLGIEIVAEGIERPEQLELLRAMGCGLGQGYLVARPMAAGRIESLAVLGGRKPAFDASDAGEPGQDSEPEVAPAVDMPGPQGRPRRRNGAGHGPKASGGGGANDEAPAAAPAS